ncbi:MAG: DUF4209 domain-containing protein [Solirubrobacterales bacterium]|nr:DUF4209 domain-containing protein [Solirubrobacterales bacterium]
MTLGPNIKSALESALSDCSDPLTIRQRLEQSGQSEKDPASLAPFVQAFSYMLHDRTSPLREEAGGPYGPMFSGTLENGEPFQFPPPLGEITDDYLDEWAASLEEIDSPILKARVADLLWERKYSDGPHQFAKVAIDAIAHIATQDEPSAIERAQLLSRAIEISLQVSDGERTDMLVKETIEFVKNDLDGAQEGPGIPLVVARPLSALPEDHRPDVQSLLSDIDAVYGSDPHIYEEIQDLRAELTGPEDAVGIRHEQIQRWRDEAGKSDVLLRLNHLEHALELAAKYGFAESADEIRAEIGEISPDDLNLSRVSTEISFPSDQIDAFRTHFEEAEDAVQALIRLAAQPPPSVGEEEVSARIKELMEVAPIQFLITQSLIGPDNAGTIFRATDPETHRTLAMSQDRAFQSRRWSILAAEALEIIRAKYDIPDRETVSSAFAGEFVSPAMSDRFARGLELYWEGQYDESAHLVVPRIERVIRDIARGAGTPILKEQNGARPGQVLGLGSILGRIEHLFSDEALFAYFKAVLVDQLGLNLRNSISHGLSGPVDRLDAALLLHVALILGAMGSNAASTSAAP